ncbi:MAG: type II secretion system F family protein [Lachnospiraceae bacterium]|nr:type II secretion system F family protein [Lachnospiraceae bacterium]
MNRKKGQGRPFSNMEVSAFCSQIALILKSGISSLEGVTIMLEDATSPEEKAVLEKIIENMQETGSLYQALSETGLFPSYMIHMIQIGEETGTLDEVMESLSVHYEQEDAIAKSIKSAVIYPLIMGGMMVIVIIILLVKVMPMFNQVFVQLGTEMTGLSRMLMNLGNAINQYSIVLIALLLAAVAAILFCTHTQPGRQFFRKAGYHLGFIRPIYEEIAACRFASGMALTLSSGLNPDQSMELVQGLSDDPVFLEKLQKCQKQMEEGEDLSEALRSAGIFSGVYARMASIGSKTGSMEQVMDRLSKLYQDNIDSRMNNALAILEPTLVIILSLVVGVILLSVMLPLTGIMSSL